MLKLIKNNHKLIMISLIALVLIIAYIIYEKPNYNEINHTVENTKEDIDQTDEFDTPKNETDDTNSSEEVKDDITSDEEIEDTSENENTQTNNNQDENNQTDNTQSDNNTNTTKPDISEDNSDNTSEENPTDIPDEVIPPDIINYEEENKKLQQDIIDIYRVSVLYDDKAFYTHNGVSATKTSIEDEELVNSFLKDLKIYLGHFPQSIFDTLRMEVGFSIHILKQLPDGKAGYAVFQPYGSYRMVLDVDTNLVDRILYHETFHLMDRYMYWQNGGKDAFTEWESYNPKNFTYGSSDTKYTWIDKESDIKDIVFVSTYSKTNVLEDRAELFTDLMFRSTKKTFMNEGYGINEKAIYLDSIIDKYFGNFNNARWERWITR